MAHNARRINLLNTTMKSKKEKEEEQQAVWEARFKKRYNDQRRREHEDSLKFFQKMVIKGEDLEQNLYNSVRNAEYTRQKQEQSVRRIKQNLSELKQKNAQKIKSEMAESFKQEQEMEQQLIREKAVLDKVS
ncbi:hypothetical protein KUTeg_003941 [Tegillarca granosa]|uniref:Flagellar FliJ protein n=1 Tax=Tegillarca granosa TaxID=220873 RepID=A0ABQ9FRD5_TEGGR|nr:hypothetical protein KUTeg_003941 [Tegillarca granosa]